jgi:putative proteasome-type protease
MTYCLAMHLDDGLVFMSDTRTNAGIDNISSYRKLHVLRPAPPPPSWAARSPDSPRTSC